jgi:transposase
MRFYTGKHRHYCGIDLHTRKMYVCIVDAEGEVLFHSNLDARPDELLEAIAPYRDDLVVCTECMHCWYWVADLCAELGIPFVLGHALYMKAIHGAKTKNDRIDSEKIAFLLRGGLMPQAYVYPRDMRSTRDLLRRRSYLVQKRTSLLAHIQTTNAQHNLPAFEKTITKSAHRNGIELRFDDAVVQRSIEADCDLVQALEVQIKNLETFLEKRAKIHDAPAYYLLRSVPGIGRILAMTILYEIHQVERFPTVSDFSSYARLVKCAHTSNGKVKGHGGAKIGNAHLKWAFSEAGVLFLRCNKRGKDLLARLEKKHGRAKALSVLASKIGRAAYYMLKRGKPFDTQRFYSVA